MIDLIEVFQPPIAYVRIVPGLIVRILNYCGATCSRAIEFARLGATHWLWLGVTCSEATHALSAHHTTATCAAELAGLFLRRAQARVVAPAGALEGEAVREGARGTKCASLCTRLRGL